jgi:hypothetical protein
MTTPQRLDLRPQLLDLPRRLVRLDGPQERGGQVAHGVGHLRVQLAAPGLVDRLAQQRHHVAGRAQRGVVGTRQHRRRLAPGPPARLP